MFNPLQTTLHHYCVSANPANSLRGGVPFCEKPLWFKTKSVCEEGGGGNLPPPWIHHYCVL